MRIGVIADPHVSVDRIEPASWHNPYRLEDSHERLVLALAHPLIADVDVVAVLGDVSHFGDRNSLDRSTDAVATTGCPAVVLSGNHDVLEEGVRLDMAVPDDALELFAKEGFGLDVYQVTELTTRRVEPFDVIADRLLERSSEDAPHVVLSHFPLLSLEERARDAALLYSAHLSQLAPPVDLDVPEKTVVLCGHLHIRGVTVDAGALQISFAALVEVPYEVALVEITDTTVTYECASVRKPDAEMLPVLDPAEGGWTWSGATWEPPR